MALFFSPLNFAIFAMLLLVLLSQYQHSGKSFGKGCNPPTRRIARNLGENPIQHDKSPNTKGQTQEVPKYIRANQVPNTTGHAIGKTNTTRMEIILNNTMWSDPRRNTSQQIPMTQKSRQKPGNSKSPIQPGMASGQKYSLWVHNNYINTLTFIPAQNNLNQKDWSSWEPKTRTMVQTNTTKSNQMTLRSSLLHNFSSATDTVRRYRPHRTTGQPNSAMINSRNHSTSRLDYLPLVTAAPTQTSESGKAPTTRNIAQTHSTYIREYAEYRRLYVDVVHSQCFVGVVV